MKVIKSEFEKVLKQLASLNRGTKVLTADHDKFIFTQDKVGIVLDDFLVFFPWDGFKESFMVNGNDLVKFVSKAKTEELDLEFNGTELQLSADKLRSGLSITDSKDSVALKILDKCYHLQWEVLPEDFIEGISLCQFSISRNLASGALCYLYCDTTHLYSSDNFRISKYELAKPISSSFLLSYSACDKLLQLSDVMSISFTDPAWLFFECNGIIAGFRKVDFEFPTSVASFFGQNITGNYIFPSQVEEQLPSVMSIVEDIPILDLQVFLKKEKGTLLLRYQKVGGWAEREIEVADDGVQFEFHINPIFFQQILEKTKTASYNNSIMQFSAEKFEHLFSMVSE
jgi:hypothetical protein